MANMAGKLLGFVNWGEPSVSSKEDAATEEGAPVVQGDDLKLGQNSAVPSLGVQACACGYVYDPRMMAHTNTIQHHDEQPARISEIFQTLVKAGCIARMEKITGREVTQDEVMLVHAKSVMDELEGLACAYKIYKRIHISNLFCSHYTGANTRNRTGF